MTEVQELRQSPFASVSDDILLPLFSSPKDQSEAKVMRIQAKPYRPDRPKVSSGFLDTLPLELVDAILLSLDCKSLSRMAATNSIFEFYIKNLPSYKLVVENCQTALCAMKNSASDRTYSMGEIYDVFRSPRCSACNDLGPWLFLPKLKRSCRNCLGNKDELRTVGIEEVMSSLDLKFAEAINMFPFFARGAWTYFCVSDVLDFARKHKIRLDLPAGVPWDTAVQFPFVMDPKDGIAEFGKHCMSCAWSVQRRYPCVDVQAPYVLETVEAEDDLRRGIFRVYSSEGLLEHIRGGECAMALEYWNGLLVDVESMHCLPPTYGMAG